MNRLVISTLLTSAVLMAAGCMNSKEEYTLNPGGTGKVIYESKMPLGNMLMDQNDDQKKLMLQQADRILKGSEGVVAWKDVSFGIADDGKMNFKGTAYFRDIERFGIGGNFRRTGDKMSFKKTDDGKMILAWEEKAKGDTKAPAAMTEEEVTKKAMLAKLQFQQQARPMLAMMLNGMRMERIVHLPGKLEKTNVFTNDGNNTVSLLYDGEKIKKVVEELTGDDNWWKEQIKTGLNMREGPDMTTLNEKLFGQKGHATATVDAGDKPLFDFKAEVTAAQQNYEAMRKELGLPLAPAPVPAAKEGKLKSVRVGGAQIIYEDNQEQNIRPFNQQEGFSLSVIAEFDGSVIKVKEGKLHEAITDNDEDLILMTKGDWDRKIHWPRLFKNNAGAVFDVKMQLPSDMAKGIKLISGELTYLVSEKDRIIDLGELDLKDGTKGKEMDFEIESVKESQWNKGHWEIKIKLTANQDTFKEVKFIAQDGLPLELQQSGSSRMNDELGFTYSCKIKPPEKATVQIVMYDDMKEFTVPFKIENIDLLGRPVGDGKKAAPQPGENVF